jgi:hypothetical protein
MIGEERRGQDRTGLASALLLYARPKNHKRNEDISNELLTNSMKQGPFRTAQIPHTPPNRLV